METLKPNFSAYSVGLVPLREAKAHCVKWHYSNIFPPHCMLTLGYEDDVGLAGVGLWGWGVRPRHTIQKLFPSLNTRDYWELNRLCLQDDCPKNSESWFISKQADFIRKNQPDIKILLSWADGIRGKPGYIYQAASWLYGGFIETEIYLTSDGEPVHPRMLITRYGSRSKAVTESLGLKKVWGKQFIYAKFLCSKKQTRELLSESSVEWSQNYPKHSDLTWEIQGEGKTTVAPTIKQAGVFRNAQESFL